MKRAHRSQQGIVLLEGLIAVAIFAVGVLALVGLQAVSIKNASEAKYRADASFLANELVAKLWVDRGNLAAYNGAPPAEWTAHVARTLPTGSGNIAIGTDPASNSPTATVTVTWIQPGGSKHTYVTIARINGAP